MVRPSRLPARAAQALAIAVALIAGTAVAPAAAAGSDPPRVQLPPAATRPATQPNTQVGHEHVRPLLNGDRVSIVRGPAGQPTVAILGTTPGLGGRLIHLSSGGAGYEIPVDALPYLGHGLDPSLFSVASLGGLSTAGTLPVTLTYHGARPALPGVTITGAAAGIATGYLTTASARTFGAALLRQFLADHARDSYGAGGLFAGGLTISLTGTPRMPLHASPARPDYVMHTLTVHGTNLAGKPDTGDEVLIVNADNADRFGAGITLFTQSLNSFDHGVVKYSVPAGHYWAVGMFVDQKNPSIGDAERLAILSQFTVSGNTSVRLDERTATSALSITTPRPSVLIESTLQLVRFGAAGPAIGVVGFAFTGFPLFVSPTSSRPTVGRFATYASAQLTSPKSAPQPYFYNIADQDRSGLVRSQRLIVRPASLATVTARYYADAPSGGAAMPTGFYPGQPNPGEAFAVNMPIPEQRTEYFTAGSPVAATWFDEFFQNSGTLDTGQSDSGRSFSPGEVTAENWNQYPLHTTTNVNAAGARAASFEPQLVSASRAKNTLTLDLSPFGDNDPGHNAAGYVSKFDGSLSPTSGSYEVDENGKQIAAGNPLKSLGETGGDLYTHLPLAAGPGTIRVALNATRTGQLYTLSTTTQTVWTWRSVPAPGTVPAGWACQWSPRTGPTGHACTPQPLMTLNYDVAGMDLTGTAPAEPQTVGLHVGHMALTSGAKVTSVTAQVSFDDGKTWQPATVTGSGDSYQAAFINQPDSFVSLKVTATDAAGGQIAETIIRAYATGSALPPPALRPACPRVPANQLRCFTLYAPQRSVNRAMAAGAAVNPAGWGARDIESAYRLPVAENPHQTVAVVDAFRAPNLSSYLNTYRNQYGLPPCTSASGCLRIVNQQGADKPLPVSGVPFGWALETALDVEMVSAACPACRILVVEAKSPAPADLATAEDTAARLGATVISNSYGGGESGFSMPYAKAYRHPGHTIVVSSGDLGFGGANFPASLGDVTAVGGTQLAEAATKRGWTERVWNSEGGASASGCSAYVAKPAWQHDAHCAMRTTTDVSAVAVNVAVYSRDFGGWVLVAGTSISAPLIAGIYGLAGNAATIKPGYEYAHAKWLYDVTAGNNDVVAGTGAQCGGDYLCVAKPGYDAPTGLGTPHGTGAF